MGDLRVANILVTVFCHRTKMQKTKVGRMTLISCAVID